MKKLVMLICLNLMLSFPTSVQASPYPLANILEEKEARALLAEKIETTDDLLLKAATSAARARLAKTTGIPLARLTECVEISDLVRIKGVGLQMVKLLRFVGVNTVKQLRKQNAKDLAARIEMANAKAKITETPPNAEQLDNWISQAKKLKLLLA